MQLNWIELQGFRSYPHLEFEPAPGTNLLVGANGAGKTNLLEAVAYLSTLRSFRGVPDDALISSGREEAIVRGSVDGRVSTHTIEVELSRARRRRVLLDGKRPSRHSVLRGYLRCVTFLPDDLEIIKGSAGRRRAVLDDLAAQLRPTAAADQSEFERALKQRNALLRADGPLADEHSLAGFEAAIAETGARVVGHRRAAAGALAPFLEAVYERLGGDAVRWQYVSSWASWGEPVEALTEALARALAETRRRDMDRRLTSRGPQRDEPQLFLDDRNSRTHASQGEQRSLVLALRLASYDVLAESFDEPPLLLLDDVFSELDPTRAQAVIDRLPEGQAFLTSARRDDVGAVRGMTWAIDPTGKVVPS